MLGIRSIHHLGIRVTDASRAEAFYAALGFEVVERYLEHGVVILRHPAGVEINFIVNAEPHPRGNVLMEESRKYPGYTHMALEVGSIEETQAQLRALDIEPSGAPERLGDGVSLFVRDPDHNVIELREPDR